MKLRRSSWAGCGLLLCALAAIAVGTTAHGRKNPSRVAWEGSAWRIERRNQAQAVVFDFIPEGGQRPSLSLSGSTDANCDPPWIAVLDVDGDRRQDVYFQRCSGHGFVKYDGKLSFVDLGQFDPADAPGLRTAWFSEIERGGSRSIAVGIALAFLALLTCSVGRLAGRRSR